MKKYSLLFISLLVYTSCVDNDLEEYPNDDPFPFRLVLDAEEGGDLPGSDEYAIEVKFADYIGELPAETITLKYEISDMEDDLINSVSIDKVVYEVDLEDCTWEREIEFTSDGNGLSGTITIEKDTDLDRLPESFEVVLRLPGEDSKGKFTFSITELNAGSDILLGTPAEFEYETLDNDVAGEWELTLENEEAFENFKAVFGPLNDDLAKLSFNDITGVVKAEFEYEEIKFEVELAEEEEVVSCENGETETEMEHKVIEIESEYEAEDGEITFEGSHFISGDDGEIEDELDFIVNANYEADSANETLLLSFIKVVDEDNFVEDEELFRSDEGTDFTFTRD